jgi:hypothetical protein
MFTAYAVRGPICILPRPPPKRKFSLNKPLFSTALLKSIGLPMRQHGEPTTPESLRGVTGIEVG